MRQRFVGSIASVRAVEDCIRATKRYTEGIMTRRTTHPVQGEDFPLLRLRRRNGMGFLAPTMLTSGTLTVPGSKASIQ